MVETAFALPVCLLMLFGVLEYSRFFMVRNVLANAAREGARYAVIHTRDKATSDVEAVVTASLGTVQAQLTGFAIQGYPTDSSGNEIGGSWNNATFGAGIGVKLSGDYQPVLPSFLLMPGLIHVETTSVMNSEGN